MNKKRIEIKVKDTFRHIVGTMMVQLKDNDEHAQVSVKEGIKRHGAKAIAAVLKEYTQLHDKDVFDPEDATLLTEEAKKAALNLLTMVKKKRDESIKGRACADGRKQRLYIPKEEVTSPTVQLESLILTMLIDAQEGRDIAVADVGGAFLLSEMPDYVRVKITGKLVDIMCLVRPEYDKFVTIENGRKILYMRLKIALNGCM